MRKVWLGVMCAGIGAGLCGAAAAAEVKVWVPTPVKAEGYKAPAVKTVVNVANTVVLVRESRPLYSNEWTLDPRYGGYRGFYYIPRRYPF